MKQNKILKILSYIILSISIATMILSAISFGFKNIFNNIMYFYLISIIIGGVIYLFDLNGNLYFNYITMIVLSPIITKILIKELTKFKLNINDKINIGDTILTLYTNKELPQIDKDKLLEIKNRIAPFETLMPTKEPTEEYKKVIQGYIDLYNEVYTDSKPSISADYGYSQLLDIVFSHEDELSKEDNEIKKYIKLIVLVINKASNGVFVPIIRITTK